MKNEQIFDLLNPDYHTKTKTYSDDDFPYLTQNSQIGIRSFCVENYARNTILSCKVFYSIHSYSSKPSLKVNRSSMESTNWVKESLDEISCFSQDETFLMQGRNLLSQGIFNFEQNSKKIALYFDSQKKNPIVIFLHSHGGNMMEGVQLIRVLVEQNIDVCLFDFSGFGRSSGKEVGLGVKEIHDLQAVVNHLKKSLNYSKLGLYGKSLGAIVSLNFAAQSFNPSFIILDSLICHYKQNLKKMISLRSNSWFQMRIIKIGFDYAIKQIKQNHQIDIDKINILRDCQMITIPVLLIYGQQDELISMNDRKTIQEHLNYPEIFEIPNTGHFEDKLMDKKVRQKVVNFCISNFQQIKSNSHTKIQYSQSSRVIINPLKIDIQKNLGISQKFSNENQVQNNFSLIPNQLFS